MAFMSSPSSTNEVNTANVQVSTANSPVGTADTPDSTDTLTLMSMRARRYFQRTSKKITINGSDTARYDKSKVECFNCHKMGHFAKECRGPRNQDNRNKNQDSSRRTMNVEETSSKAMVAIDGAGFDWSFMADEDVPINMALMAFSDSEVHNDKTFTNTCLKSFETLKTQYDNLRIEFNLATYKRGLASVEEQLVFYKKNEVMFCDQIAVLKRDTSIKDSEINAHKSEIEKLKKEKESNQIKIDKFENASKSLDKLIGSLFAPPTINLSNSGLKEFQQPEFEGYGPKASKSICKDTSNKVKKTPDAPLDDDDDDDVGAEVDMNNLNTFIPVSPILTTKLHKDYPLEKIIGDIHSAPQTKRVTKSVTEHGNLRITRSKLERSYARRVAAVQITIGLDFDGFTTWQKSYWY
ncbi:ribonuclease H-like domain-containing protein [Tanacetum coccineum]